MRIRGCCLKSVKNVKNDVVSSRVSCIYGVLLSDLGNRPMTDPMVRADLVDLREALNDLRSAPSGSNDAQLAYAIRQVAVPTLLPPLQPGVIPTLAQMQQTHSQLLQRMRM